MPSGSGVMASGGSHTLPDSVPANASPSPWPLTKTGSPSRNAGEDDCITTPAPSFPAIWPHGTGPKRPEATMKSRKFNAACSMRTRTGAGFSFCGPCAGIRATDAVLPFRSKICTTATSQVRKLPVTPYNIYRSTADLTQCRCRIVYRLIPEKNA